VSFRLLGLACSPRHSYAEEFSGIDPAGYEIHMKNRKIVAKNRSGGIILGYRQEIASKIKPLHTNSKYVFWFKVSSDLV
jgi:hypothetical protein